MAEKWNALHRLVVITERLQDESVEMNGKVPDWVKQTFYRVTPAVKKFIEAQLVDKLKSIKTPHEVNFITSMVQLYVSAGDFEIFFKSVDEKGWVKIKSDNIEFRDPAYVPDEKDFRYTFTRRTRQMEISEKDDIETHGNGLDRCYEEILRFLGIYSNSSSREKDKKIHTYKIEIPQYMGSVPT